MIMSTPISFYSSAPSMLQCNNNINHFTSSITPLSLVKGTLNSAAWVATKRNSSQFTCRTDLYEDDDYLIDAPVQVGDGFYFAGGKYSNEPSPADEWFKTGKLVEAYPVSGTGKAKDPIFGLTMGDASQTSEDLFRWFCVESGSVDKPSIVLIHGLPSQAYSYRKVLPILSKNYHVIAFDWLGFGFSDKPQSGYGFDYTLDGEAFFNFLKSRKTLRLILRITSRSTFCQQGFTCLPVVKYACNHQERIDNLILLNSPLTGKHANLPSTLSIFSNFLLGEIFSQESVEGMRRILMDKEWKVRTTIYWGQSDRCVDRSWTFLDLGRLAISCRRVTIQSKIKMTGLPTSRSWKRIRQRGRTTICG